MSHFAYRDGMLHAEEVPLPQIAAAHGTPCYVYSRAALLSRFEEFRQALCGRDALVCYTVKANSNLAILNLFARLAAAAKERIALGLVQHELQAEHGHVVA